MMTNAKKNRFEPNEGTQGRSVDDLASRALREIARRIIPAAEPGLDPHWLTALKTGALSRDRFALENTLARMLQAGIDDIAVSDLYIPEVARDLGEEWCRDGLSFAEVSIGSARLQSVLRSLGPEWRGDLPGADGAYSVLVATAHGIFHTLGAVLLTGQLRRRGFGVQLSLDTRPEMLLECLQDRHFHTVFFSASCGESLESLRQLVKVAKTARSEPPLVVVGGGVLDGDVAAADIQTLTGADLATKSIDEALFACGQIQTTPSRDGRTAV